MLQPQSKRARASTGGAARIGEVFAVALRLGLTAFGGPIAHLGHFERCYVRERRWLSGADYAGLVALCQMIPGPTSSQVGFLIGLRRAGWGGALAAWAGFTLPSAALLYACAVLVSGAAAAPLAPLLHGLKLAAIAVVAQAVWSMARTLCPDRATAAIALGAAVVLSVRHGAALQLLVLLGGALAGVLACRRGAAAVAHPPRMVGLGGAGIALGLCVLLLVLLPVLGARDAHGPLALFALFYRAGALVFGGGHVVLPLLREMLVPAAWISDADFLAGYGFAQAVPGPLFTLAAYVGGANAAGLPALPAAAIALAAVFLPGLLLAVAGTALWEPIARHAGARGALAGVNAAVVGVLAAALYDPVWLTGVGNVVDALIAVAGCLLLQRWKLPPLALVALCVAAAVLLDLAR